MGCRRRAATAELVRIVRRPDGSLAISPASAGRGAWLCRGSATCFSLAARRRAFGRSLRATVGDEAVRALGRELAVPADVRGYGDAQAPFGSA